MNLKSFFTAAAMTIGLSSAPSFAVTLIVDGSGQLTGATGITVGADLYNVEFQDGACSAIYDGCDETSDFTFQTEADAVAASRALLESVFIDGTDGSFDSDASLTRGVSAGPTGDNVIGFILTPFKVDPSISLFNTSPIYNYDAGSFADAVGPFTTALSPDFQTTPTDDITYARWELQIVAPVPLPAGGMLLLSALGGIAALRRRKKSTA